MPKKASQSSKDIVLERIDILFSKAGESLKDNPGASKRYVELALKNAMRYNVPVPSKYRMSYCSRCHSYLKPGVSSVHRTSPKQDSVIVTCGECGHVMRFPYRKEKARERRAGTKK